MLMTNVLLIDDDAILRNTLREMLEKLSCDVTEAEDGVVATEKMEETDFDLVITDIFMPNQDGIETIRNIRRARNDVHIVAISGGPPNQRVNFLKMAKSIGADLALAKPIDIQQLADILGKIKNKN